jgi:hypothetical protein
MNQCPFTQRIRYSLANGRFLTLLLLDPSHSTKRAVFLESIRKFKPMHAVSLMLTRFLLARCGCLGVAELRCDGGRFAAGAGGANERGRLAQLAGAVPAKPGFVLYRHFHSGAACKHVRALVLSGPRPPPLLLVCRKSTLSLRGRRFRSPPIASICDGTIR